MGPHCEMSASPPEPRTIAVARMPRSRVQCPWRWWMGRWLRIRSSRNSRAVKVRLCGSS